MGDVITTTFFAILAAGFLVGIVVGLTGMGGGALMTPALIFLGVGEAATVVTADLTAAAVYKTGGAIVHKREGSPHMALAKWLVIGSVPMALLGPFLVSWVTDRCGRARHPAEALHRLRAALRRRHLRVPALDQPAPGPRRHAQPGRAPRGPRGPHVARRHARRPARGRDQRRLRLGHHDRAADALPRPVRGEAGRHRPGAGRAAGDGRRHLQHRPPRSRLRAC